MKYLVTGAAGFIGSNLSAHLTKNGHTVLGVDNFSPYYSPQLKELRVESILRPIEIQVDRFDLCNMAATKETVRRFKPDVIVHLAAQPGVRTPLENSFEYIQNNIVAFTNLLQTAVEEEIPNFLYASSSSVYGNSTNSTYRESDMNIRPISIYGATKLANEIAAPTFIAGSKTRARGMRFFTVYGPWGRPDMAYLRIINSAINGTTFTKFGEGNVKRDFTFVDDIVVSIANLASELQQHQNGYYDVVNIGGGKPHSLNDLIKSIASQLGKSPLTKDSISNPNDTSFTCADISLLNQLTGNSPSVNLEAGVRKTISWATNPHISGELNSWVLSTN